MEFNDLGIKPVSDASPAGEDARYDPEYDELQHEIDKLSSATAGGSINWKNVATLGSSILLTKSKDMMVASYLGVALIHLEGVEGFSGGVQVMLDLVNTYWETMFPSKKRMRGRFNAIKWWADRALDFLRDYDGGDLPQDVVGNLSQRIKDLDSALSEKSEDAPILKNLADYADRLPIIPEEKPLQVPSDESDDGAELPVPQVVETSSSVSKTAAPSSVSSQTAAGNLHSEGDFLNELKTGMDSLSSVADYLLANDTANSSGYRFRRIVAWMPVIALPPSEKGKTLIPPPSSEIKNSIINQLQSGDFAGALNASESMISVYLFWLDISRLAAEALDGLGDSYSDAKTAIELETAFFTKRLRGIESMTFSDGTPFADQKTKSWLNSLNKVQESGLGGENGKGSDADGLFAKASELVKNKKIFDAVTIIQDSLNRVVSFREHFLLQLGMVRILTEVDQGGLAHVHVEEVLEHIEKFNLESWEPALALSGLKTAYEALLAEGGDAAVNLAASTLMRIARLNPVEALKINGL
ncbi:type VI secretion system protein TssA [Desulfovibrio gilichinskyi]|uniref:Type VI secretion system protein VasJ n=1 Tax=Desulfovibrio gilichinskyi TaxID=1519643 RepID=A0A1X7D6Q5_9BACT|nr:type VI secretion system protein TssA [Desulfovibrio gilichinskyi]SMF09389.1 type VI secretion system protein VasJ [Desulfovibrio gilichinskyi]